MFKKINYFCSFFVLLAIPLIVFAHPGRTDVNGCHTNRKTGDYHCHGVVKNEIKEAKVEARTSANIEARVEARTSKIESQLTEQKFIVEKVVDGDTIKVNINGKLETIRLIGLDTPETVDPRKAVQCFGREASDKAKELLTGKKVILEVDITQGELDKYNRLLRYIFLEDGTFYNKLMISEGYAHEYTYQSNPYKYQNDFKNAEKYARENKLGLWSDNTCGGDTLKPAIIP